MTIRVKPGNHLWYMPLYSGIVRDCELDPTWVIPGQVVELPCVKVLTSKPYPVFTTDSIQVTAAGIRMQGSLQFFDNMSAGASFLSGASRDQRQTYGRPEFPDMMTVGSATFLSGTGKDQRRAYSSPGYPDMMTVGAASFLSGTGKDVRVAYAYWPAERATVGASLGSSTGSST